MGTNSPGQALYTDVTEQDDAAFDRFAAAAYPRLVRAAFLLTGDRGHAEDLAQTALYATFRHWQRIEPAAAEAYARTTLVRTAGHWRRRHWHGEFATEQLPESATPDRDLSQSIDLMRALGTLPIQFRTVLVLRYFEDLTEAETATALGTTVGTVKSRTSRALARLRTDAGITLADDYPREVTA